MILPTLDFPPSASQGALAIEYNQECEKDILPHLKSVHHEPTADTIAKERTAFHSYGGGCHLAVGIHVKDVHGLKVHIHKGTVDDKQVDYLRLEGEEYSAYKGKSIYRVKGENDFLIKRVPVKKQIDARHNLFVTSSHCFHQLENSNSLWAAGNQTMKKLIQNGHWVCGSAEGFGHEEILNFKNSNAVKILLQNDNWLTLTHTDGDSIVSKALGVYENDIQPAPPLPKKLKQTDIIFWSSSIQYQAYIEAYPELKNKTHACGLGKTYQKLKELGASPLACIDYQNLMENLKG